MRSRGGLLVIMSVGVLGLTIYFTQTTSGSRNQSRVVEDDRNAIGAADPRAPDRLTERVLPTKAHVRLGAGSLAVDELPSSTYREVNLKDENALRDKLMKSKSLILDARISIHMIDAYRQWIKDSGITFEEDEAVRQIMMDGYENANRAEEDLSQAKRDAEREAQASGDFEEVMQLDLAHKEAMNGKDADEEISARLLRVLGEDKYRAFAAAIPNPSVQAGFIFDVESRLPSDDWKRRMREMGRQSARTARYWLDNKSLVDRFFREHRAQLAVK